jgi:hypothetical protein
MSRRDLEFDSQMRNLESEWRQAYDIAMAARAELQALAAIPKSNAVILAKAHDRLERAEGLKARAMAKIERLEDGLLGAGS